MTSVKNVEDLTFEEVKEQLALYNRLYYAFKANQCPEFLAKKRERQRRNYAEKKAREEAETGIKREKHNPNKKYTSSPLMLVPTQ